MPEFATARERSFVSHERNGHVVGRLLAHPATAGTGSHPD